MPMPLDPQAQSLLEAMAKLNLKLVEDSTPEEARESMRSRTAALGPVEDVAAVTEHQDASRFLKLRRLPYGDIFFHTGRSNFKVGVTKMDHNPARTMSIYVCAQFSLDTR